jgi:competence protein ComEC
VLFVSPWFIYLNPLPQVVFLNAGQGDAILLRSAFASCTIVIDTGPPKEAINLVATLRSKTVDRIDALVLTHSDADHSGNQALFEEQFDIKDTVDSKQDVTCKGMLLKNLDPLITFGEVNADSLIYATSLNHTRFLFMADGDVNTEAKLLERYDLTSDIVKLGHHGSQSASSDEFIGNIQAKLAIISVGKNSYGHPHAAVLARLNAFRLRYLTTRREGDITLTLLPGFAIVTSAREPLRIVETGRQKRK